MDGKGKTGDKTKIWTVKKKGNAGNDTRKEVMEKQRDWREMNWND